MKKALFFFLCAALQFADEAFAQYYSERSLEKSFEQNEMFFQPSYISPYGIGTFALASPGLIDDPFLNLQVNPALFSHDSAGTNHLYLDFRSYRQTASMYQPIIYPVYGAVSSYMPPIFPYYYVNSRPIIEPVISAAFLTNPLPSSLPGLFVGITYQGIMQDSKYYTIPYNIYQSYLGYDYKGAAIANSASIPITTVSTGQNNMHHSGTFLSLYAGYKLSQDLRLGIKLGRDFFDEDGLYGNNNYWDNYSYSSVSSLYSNIESRNQRYNHWDLSAGIEYAVTPLSTLGMTAGYLWGTTTQSLFGRDTSLYTYNYSSYDNLSNSSGMTAESWRHAGRTYYGGVNLTTRLNDHQTLTLLYQYNWENVDIDLGSVVTDTSYYAYSWSDGTNYSSSLSNSAFFETSGGAGTLTQISNRLLLSFNWKFSLASELTIGGVINLFDQKTSTNEPTTVTGHSYYNTTGSSYNSLYYDTTAQNKNVQWDFKVERWSFDIPIIYTHRFSEKVSMILGIDKQISEWKMTDQTLVIYYRNYDNNSYSGITDKSNYGERYISPDQDISDVNTTFLAGLTLSPSREFNVRFLMSPSVRASFEGVSVSNFQWWLGLNLYP